MLDQFEEQELLGSINPGYMNGQRVVHATGAYTDELPAAGFDAARPRARDVWTFGSVQIFEEVSPAMHQELELDYAVKWYSRFGLVYYGCCDPLHHKIDLLRQIQNLRKISMSPWAEKGADQIGGDFVLSRKPNPAIFATDTWEPDAAEGEIRETLEYCNRYGCPVEFVMKDLSTVRYHPQKNLGMGGHGHEGCHR